LIKITHPRRVGYNTQLNRLDVIVWGSVPYSCMQMHYNTRIMMRLGKQYEMLEVRV